MSIQKDLKAIFKKGYLNAKDSEEVLLDLEAELNTTQNVNLIIEELSSRVYTGNLQRTMRMVFDELEVGVSIEDAFLMHGVIEQEEYILLQRAATTKSGIKSIIAFRQEGNMFSVFLRKVILPIYSFIFFGILSLAFTTPILKDFLETQIAPLVKEKRNFTVDFQLPFFMENESYIYISIFTFIALTFFGIFLYRFFKERDISKIYKHFNIVFYDDFIKYFTIAYIMKNNGATSDQIFEDLSHQAPQGLRPVFNEMFINGSNYYETLEKANGTYRIVSKLRRNEDNSLFWEAMDTVVSYAKDLRVKKINFYNKYFSGILFYLGISFFLSCLTTPAIYLILNIFAFLT